MPADGRATGTGVCNLNFILPLEDQTGIPIRSVLRRVGCPDPDLSGEWSASTDREYFLNTIQRNPTKSIIVQAALWRAAAEALANGNPARFTNEHLTNITAADWSKRVIDVGADKISFANFIMMAYEQAATGFLADGTYLANKVDLRTATYNDSADVRTNLQRLNTEGSYSFTTASFNAVLPDAGLYEQMFQAMSK